MVAYDLLSETEVDLCYFLKGSTLCLLGQLPLWQVS